jgi:hypothetical protein
MPDPCLSPTPRISLDTIGTPGALEADIIPSALPGNGVVLESDGLWTPGRPTFITGSLPTSPSDGDEIYYLGDGTPHNVIWHLRYLAAESTSSKWIVIGGAPLVGRRTNVGTVSPGGGSAWNTLAGTDQAGPSVILPLTGYYLIQFGCDINAPASADARVGASPIGSDPGGSDVAESGSTFDTSVMAILNPYGTQFVGGTQMRLMYAADGSTGTASYQNRWLTALPLKLG